MVKFQFELFGPIGNGLGRSNKRQDLEEYALKSIQITKGLHNVHNVWDHEINTVVSVITDDANGPKIHRLDGWEPPPTCKAHEIDDDSLCLNRKHNRIDYKCGVCGEQGYTPLQFIFWRT